MKNTYENVAEVSTQTELAKFKARQFIQVKELSIFHRLSPEMQFEMEVVSKILPFRVNDFVLDHLIDWRCAPDDPIFRLVFPHRNMLSAEHYKAMAELMRRKAPANEITELATKIRLTLNPHPAEQQTLNVPSWEGTKLTGLQHKYENTVLFFPAQGQTCHSYCSFCFRWPQFIGEKEQRFADPNSTMLYKYLRSKSKISDLLLTGGDPMVMRTRRIVELLNPLIEEEGLDHIRTVRFGTKSLTFWPQRFLSDEDAGELLDFMKKLILSGKHVAVMAHLNHWRELESPLFIEAVRCIQSTGAVIRSQGPLLAGINDCPTVWAKMWQKQVELGIVPYYMFVERDTGAKAYFEVPLARAYEIYTNAIKLVSGLARTARGPSMSCGPGKIQISGITEIHGEKVFILNFLQGRNPQWVNRSFFAKFDPRATWFNQLVPAFEEKKFFFSEQYESMLSR